MRLMGIDYGIARLGIALSDESGTIAAPFTTIKNENTVNKIKNIINEKKVEKIILGIPSDSEGRDTKQSKRIRNFHKKLEEKIDIPIELFDENYSTREAYSVLKQMGLSMKKSKKRVDEVAASIILEEYIKYVKKT